MSADYSPNSISGDKMDNSCLLETFLNSKMKSDDNLYNLGKSNQRKSFQHIPYHYIQK